MSSKETDAEDAGPEPPKPATTLEIVATAFSAMLILALLAVLVADAVRPNAEPSFTTSAGVLRERGESYRVPITVRNLGDDAARSVVVHAELVEADTTVDETDVTVDWLPGKSSRDIVALFLRGSTTSRPNSVRTEVRGFAVP
jgi:uncharacterized protein (TIGR02588 family)